MSDDMKALIDAAQQPTLEEIIKAAVSHGVEDPPTAENEMRIKRIVAMVRALFANRFHAQQVPVIGQAMAWHYEYLPHRKNSTWCQALSIDEETAKTGAVRNAMPLVAMPSQFVTVEALQWMKEFNRCVHGLLGSLNEDSDGGMFLCKEAVPEYEKALELSAALSALLKGDGDGT